MKQRKLMEDEEIENVNEIENDHEHIEFLSMEWGYSGNSSDFNTINGIYDHHDENYFHYKKLSEKIDEVFSQSRWTVLDPNKKVPKDLISMVFQDILDGLDGTQYTNVEKFVAICDYMSIGYLKAYDSIHMKYKEKIVMEMDDKFNVLGKKGIKKIF